VTTSIVLPWPLQRRLEATTRVLFEPVDRPSLDFSQPAGEAALVSPNSVSWRVLKNPFRFSSAAEPRVRTGVWERTNGLTNCLGARLLTLNPFQKRVDSEVAHIGASFHRAD
jgi:uncharacterized protein (DUF2236 family)